MVYDDVVNPAKSGQTNAKHGNAVVLTPGVASSQSLDVGETEPVNLAEGRLDDRVDDYGGASQTPWTSNIDAAGFDLTGVDLVKGNVVASAGQTLTVSAADGVGDMKNGGKLVLKSGDASGELQAFAGDIEITCGANSGGTKGNLTITCKTLDFNYADASAIANATNGTDVITQLNALLNMLRQIGLLTV